MKNIQLLLVICLLGLSMGCKKNDDNAPMEIALQNEPPLSFDLINVPDGAEDVDVTPTLSWESAKNPKGGEVTYDLYLGSEVNPTTLFQGDINDTSFEITDRLYLLSDYYWKIVAKDADGKTSQSSVHKFSTRNLNFSEEAITYAANFTARFRHSTVVFKNKIWVIGGFGDEGYLNDVWHSDDGLNWTEATSSAGFSSRFGHTSVVFNDKIWVIGGYDGAQQNDVWSSDDGANWMEVTSSAQFSERNGHSSVVFDNKIWVIGGNEDSDIWYSSDGTNWIVAVAENPFLKRTNHASMVFDKKIWLVGGSYFEKLKNDIWYSSDGINWMKAASNSNFSSRENHALIPFRGKLWVIGGRVSYGVDGLQNDIWYSSDGLHWNQSDDNAPFSKRMSHSSVIYNDRLWNVGGVDSEDFKNDIWAMD
ncbi:Kelch repeat-containing protein [Maribacter halichondriae]|uniref:Kelch repeat-containing protein n=1 Tax=Maribacter halichondriae TaxID=2980554 RepID=UPI002359F354|nr:kelch repeat-containing protein [Maribacter sp. Hal144]